MRLTQYRVYSAPVNGGLVSVTLLKVHYKNAKIVGHEVVLIDWCEPEQLNKVAGQFFDELANQVLKDSGRPDGAPPLRIV